MAIREDGLAGITHPAVHRPMSRRSPDRQLLALVRALWDSEHRTRIVTLALGIALVICATAFGQVRLNAWNQPFYDAVAHKDVATFLHQLLVFTGIVAMLLALNVAQAWLLQTIKLRLREG